MHCEFSQLGYKRHQVMFPLASPRQNDIGLKQRSRELEMAMSSPKGTVGTIVAKKQYRLQWAHHLYNGGLNMVPSFASGL